MRGKRTSAPSEKERRRSEYSKRKREERLAAGLCAVCGKNEFRPQRKTCDHCAFPHRKYDSDTTRKWHKKWLLQVQEAIFEHYGRVCVCCGEDNPLFLTLDHINNDGNIQRMGRSHNTWTQAASDGFPEDLQMLCYNCNLGKTRNNGVCPHRSALTSDEAALANPDINYSENPNTSTVLEAERDRLRSILEEAKVEAS